MDSKKFVWLGVFVGSSIGSLIPELWGAGMFPFSSILFGATGALIGLWFGFRLSQWW